MTHAPLFRAVYGMTPDQMRAMRVGDFNRHLEFAADWLRLRRPGG